MGLSATTTNGAPTLSRTPLRDGGQFVNDLAAFQALTVAGRRYAANFAGADLGAKVNAAIADLSGGGEVWLPPGASSFSTPIVIETSSIRLRGVGSYSRFNPAASTTLLTFTGAAGNAITIGDGVSRTQGVGLEDFRLKYPAIAGNAVEIKSNANTGLIRGLYLDGTSDNGTGILTGDTSTIAWFAERLTARNFNIGLDLNTHTWSNYIGCYVNDCATGVRLGNSNIAVCVNFIGCDFEQNVIDIDIVDADTVNIRDSYFETEEGVTSRMLRVGVGGTVCNNINLVGCRNNPVESDADDLIEISNVRGMLIEGNRFVSLGGGGGRTVILNNATSVNQLVIRGNVYDAADILISDTTGVVEMHDRDGNVIYPNMPDGDPSVAGALYRVSTGNNQVRWSTG